MNNKSLPLFIALICCLAGKLRAQDSYKLHFSSGTKVVQANAESFFHHKELFQKHIFGGHYLVVIQFNHLPDASLKARIQKLGIRLMDYIPDYAYLASLPQTLDLKQADALDIRAIVPLSAADKLDGSLLSVDLQSSTGAATGYVDVNVNIFSSVDAKRVKEDLGSSGIEIKEFHPEFSMMVLRVPRSKMGELAEKPWLLHAEPASQPVLLNSPGRSNSRANVLADGVRGLNGDGIRIGLWDGGIVGPHLDFTGRLTQVETSDLNPYHATHVAGTMTGAGILDPQARGMAPKASCYVYSLDNGQFVPFEMYEAVQNYGITITQNSYGDNPSCGAGASYRIDNRAQDQLVNIFPQLIHVFAIGNYQGWCSGGFRTTAGQAAKNTITVGALENYADEITSFSSWGPVKDGRVKPDVCAIGAEVYSTQPGYSYAANGWSGTSMACPVVSGVAAQLSQRYRQLNSNTNPVASLVKAVLCNTAQDLGNAGPDYKFGYGRVNALDAVKTLEENRYKVDRVTQGATKTLTVQVPSGATKLRLLLCWSDPAAATGTSVALVNDLNLKVKDATSTTWLPWVLDPATPGAVATRAVDRLNNVEQVTIENPVAGTYQVEVSGFNIPVGADQQYALTWQVDKPGIELTWPAGHEKLAIGSTATIRWDCESITTACKLEYSINNGATWTTITTTAPAINHYYNWTVPGVMTSQALIRISSGEYSDVSDAPFVISATPGVSVTSGTHALTASWNGVTGATGYDVMMLNKATGNWEVLAGNVTGTSYTANGLVAGEEYWLTVRTRHNSTGVVGEMAVAKKGVPLKGAAVDIAVTAITAPVVGCDALSEHESVTMRIKNAGTAVVGAGTVIPVSYAINGAPAVAENMTLAAPLAADSSATYIFTRTADLSAMTTYNLVVRSDMPGDMVTGNDQLSQSIISPVPPPIFITGNAHFCDSTTLSAAGITPTMRAISIPFAPVSMTGATPVPLGDDDVTGALPIGFTFNFFGKNYTQFYIGSNGLIGFDQFGIEYSSSPQVMPHPDVPNNIIAMAWTDLAPNMGGSIRYMTTGTAPQRKLVVAYEDVPRWTWGEPTAYITGQIILYEGSNLVEFHILKIESDESMPTSMGAESSTGKEGLAVNERSNTLWEAANEGIRLEPFHPAITWQPGGQTTTSINVTISGRYGFTVTEKGCSYTRYMSVTNCCTTTPPVVTTLVPADNASRVAVTANLVMTFSEEIRKGTGNIILRKYSDNSAVETFNVATSPGISVLANKVTIDPTNDLNLSENYYVEVPGTAFRTECQLFYAGTSGKTTWNFATLAPVITVSVTGLHDFEATTARASAARTYTISGAELVDHVEILSSAAYELSRDGNTWSNRLSLGQNGGVLSGTPLTIRVRLKAGLAPGTVPGTLTHTSTGAATKTISLDGTVISLATVYVRPDGNDVNNGVSNTPGGAKRTLQAALNLVDEDGKVIIAAGEYRDAATNTKTITLQTSGTVTLQHLVMNGAGKTLTLDGTIGISEKLSLQAGTVASGGNLVLLSSPSATALIDDFSPGYAGTITGRITAQRDISSATGGYRYLASPVSGAKVAQLDLVQQYPSYYRESLVTAEATSIDAGWVAMADTATVINPVQGLSAYYSSGSRVLHLAGTANTGNFSTTVTRTVNGAFTGYNVIGNPYPSPVSWSDIWQLNNNSHIHKTVYVWNNSMNKSALYNFATGAAANGGSNEIAQGQAFRIRVNTVGHSTTFNLDNSVRLSASSGNFLRKEPGKVSEKLRLVLSSDKDKAGYETLIHSVNDATAGMDAAYDGEFAGDKGVDVIYSKADGAPMTINALPELEGERTVALGVEVQQAGLYTISATEIENFAPGTAIYLEDRKLGRLVDLTKEPFYPVYLAAAETNRFFVHFNTSERAEGMAASFVNIYSVQNEVNVQFPGAATSKGTITIVNMLGQAVAEVKTDKGQQLANLELDVPEGVYIVRVMSESGMVSKKVFLSAK